MAFNPATDTPRTKEEALAFQAYNLAERNKNNPSYGTPISGTGTNGLPPRNDMVGQAEYNQTGQDLPDGRDGKRPGETDEQYKERVRNSDFGLAGGEVDAPRGLSPAESQAMIKKYGLTGLTKLNLEGLTIDQATDLATKKKREILGAATLDNTSSYYDVTKLNNIKKTNDYLMSSLNEVKNDPWSTPQDKTVQMKSIVDNATGEYARLFASPEDFIKAYQTDPAFTNSMKTYIKSGGTVADVAKRIQSQINTDLPSQQTTAEYLANVKYRPEAAFNAEASLEPERVSAIEEINRLAKVPDEYRDLYYGTPEKIGYFTKVKEEANTTIKNLNDAYAKTKQTSSEQFDYEVQKQKYQADADIADLEEKRLQAKTYLTGKLANIGALTTSGEAPVALTNLDAKYERSKSAVRSNFQNNQALLVSKKTETLNELDADLAEKITKIESAVNKTELEIEKEIREVTDKAEKEKKAAIDKYNSISRTTYNKYLAEANKNAKDYVKEYYKTVSGGISNTYINKLSGTIAQKKGKGGSGGSTGSGGGKTYTSGKLKYTAADIAEDEAYLKKNSGSDGYVNPGIYQQAYKAWTDKGGLEKDFLAKYPPKRWVNPANKELPAFLRSGVEETKATGRSLNGK